MLKRLLRKVLRFSFDKEFGAFEKELLDELDKEEAKTKRVEAEMRNGKKRYALFCRIFDIDSPISIVGIEKNKRNEELFVCERIYSNNLDIRLYSYSYQGISGVPRLMAEIHNDHEATAETGIKAYKIEIVDILMEDDDVGNGSIAMRYFLDAVDKLKNTYKMNITHIHGWLSSVDKEHFDRSEHYYKKFGFEIEFNEARTSGRIKKGL